MNKFLDYFLAIGFITILCVCALVFVIVSLVHMDFVAIVAGGSVLFACNGVLAKNIEEYKEARKNG